MCSECHLLNYIVMLRQVSSQILFNSAFCCRVIGDCSCWFNSIYIVSFAKHHEPMVVHRDICWSWNCPEEVRVLQILSLVLSSSPSSCCQVSLLQNCSQISTTSQGSSMGMCDSDISFCPLWIELSECHKESKEVLQRRNNGPHGSDTSEGSERIIAKSASSGLKGECIA